MMSDIYPGLSASPFHVRTAERNTYNAWVARGMFTLPRHFGDVEREAVARHFSAVLADLSSFGRLHVFGPGAARLLSASCKSEIGALPTGEAREVFWVNDGGGVRGNGVVARFGEENFVLESFDIDAGWFADVAQRFNAKVRSEHGEKSGLLLAGPLAATILKSAELELALALEDEHHEICDWNGVLLTVSRRSKLGGFELNCGKEDGVILFDRLMEFGRSHALALIGQEALELLYLEAGLPLAGLDYTPARDIGSEAPSASSLGFAAGKGHETILVGVEWDGSDLASFAPLYHNGRQVGQTLRSAYSPVFRRVIALASVQTDHAAPGTQLLVGSPERANSQSITARTVSLPFLAQI